MSRLKRLLLLAVVAAGLQLAPAPVAAHGGCPDGGVASDTPIQGRPGHAHRTGRAAVDPAAVARVFAPDTAFPVPAAHPFGAALAVNGESAGPMVGERGAARASADAAGAAAATAPIDHFGHVAVPCCGLPACGSVCHAVAPVDIRALAAPARSGPASLREVPDPAAVPAEVNPPPPRRRA